MFENLMRDVMNAGTNKTEKFDDGYFSFANNDEIALVINHDFYILNCDEDLWDITKKKIKSLKGDTKKLVSWWIKMSKEYEISMWSGDFKELI